MKTLSALRPRTRGFTILELLVAATITAMIAGFIAVIVRTVSSNWSRTSGRLGADAQARVVLDQLQLDIQSALYRDDGNVWFAAEVLDRINNAPTLWNEALRNPKPPGGLSLDLAATRQDIVVASERGKFEQVRSGKAGMWLRFFTMSRPVTNATGNTVTVPSMPTAVGYQIIRRLSATNPLNTTSYAYLLHRAEARPTTVGTRPGTLEAGFNIIAGGYAPAAANTNNNGTVTGDPRSIQVPGTATGTRNLDSVIAENVIDFSIRCYVRDATRPGGLRLVFPANAAGAPAGTATSTYRPTLPSDAPQSEWSSTTQPFPEVVDVMVRILTDEGALQIANIEKLQTPALQMPQRYLNASAWWWGVAQENSRVYTRRIVLNAKPL
ncbi:MAG: prepilin-type N-terminal cleavage/methylation domain-containing protein [Verrucomicrobiota bacterium]